MAAVYPLVLGLTLLVCAAIVWRLWNRRQVRPRAECAIAMGGRGTDCDASPAASAVSRIARETLRLHRAPFYDRDHYLQLWTAAQTRFAFDARGATFEAESIVAEMMRRRGYAVSQPERWIREAPPEQHRIVGNYVVASEIVARYRRGETTVQDLGKAMVCYRALFSQLMETAPPPVAQTLSIRTGSR